MKELYSCKDLRGVGRETRSLQKYEKRAAPPFYTRRKSQRSQQSDAARRIMIVEKVNGITRSTIITPRRDRLFFIFWSSLLASWAKTKPN
jgi:hypothetical protein